PPRRCETWDSGQTLGSWRETPRRGRLNQHLKPVRLLPSVPSCRGTAAPGTFVFSMTIQARKNCPGLPATPSMDNDKPLLRAGLLIYIRHWFNAFKRSVAIERLEPEIPYIARKPC